MDLPQISQREAGTLGNILDTMRSVIQNLRKAGFKVDEGVQSISFVLTRKMDVPTCIDFDLSLQNSK